MSGLHQESLMNQQAANLAEPTNQADRRCECQETPAKMKHRNNTLPPLHRRCGGAGSEASPVFFFGVRSWAAMPDVPRNNYLHSSAYSHLALHAIHSCSRPAVRTLIDIIPDQRIENARAINTTPIRPPYQSFPELQPSK